MKGENLKLFTILNKRVMEYKRILTQDFVIIKIPVLSGKSEKQKSFGESIRQKYIEIFNKKLNNYDVLDEKGRLEFTKIFKEYLNHPQTTKSTYWINHHCMKCGCQLIKENNKLKCSNEMCDYVKDVK